MKKRIYNAPIVETVYLVTAELMVTSGTSPDLPIDPGTPAPQREFIYL